MTSGLIPRCQHDSPVEKVAGALILLSVGRFGRWERRGTKKESDVGGKVGSAKGWRLCWGVGAS